MQDFTLQTPRGKLAGWRSGNPHQPIILALHGWLDNAMSFAELARALPNYQFVAVDLPGHGHSEHKPTGNFYYFSEYLIDLILAIESLGYPHFHLMGHSLGAGIASMLAAAIPEKIQKLILIEGIGPLTLTHASPAENLRKAAMQLQQLNSKRKVSYASLDAAALARQAAGDLSHAAALTLTTRGLQNIQGRFYWRSDPRLRIKSPHYYCEDQIADYLRAIRSPCLLIRANQGLLHEYACFESRYSLVQDMQIIDLPGGHHLHMDSAADCAAHIAQFLQ